MGAPGVTDAHEFPPVSTTLKFDPEEAALRRAEVILPLVARAEPARSAARVPARPGGREQLPRELARGHRDHRLAAAGQRRCAAPSTSPSTPRTPLPGLMVLLPRAGRRAARRPGRADHPGDPRNTFASNPDLPVRSFTLAFDGGRPDAALILTQDLCAEGSDLTMSVKLVAHNGKESRVRAGAGHAGLRPAREGLGAAARQARHARCARDGGARRPGRHRHHREAAEGA